LPHHRTNLELLREEIDIVEGDIRSYERVHNTVIVGTNEPYSLRPSLRLMGGLMDSHGTGRLPTKDAEEAIIARISEDFNLTGSWSVRITHAVRRIESIWELASQSDRMSSPSQ
jgi:hypothetical protein